MCGSLNHLHFQAHILWALDEKTSKERMNNWRAAFSERNLWPAPGNKTFIPSGSKKEERVSFIKKLRRSSLTFRESLRRRLSTQSIEEMKVVTLISVKTEMWPLNMMMMTMTVIMIMSKVTKAQSGSWERRPWGERPTELDASSDWVRFEIARKISFFVFLGFSSFLIEWDMKLEISHFSSSFESLNVLIVFLLGGNQRFVRRWPEDNPRSESSSTLSFGWVGLLLTLQGQKPIETSGKGSICI